MDVTNFTDFKNSNTFSSQSTDYRTSNDFAFQHKAFLNRIQTTKQNKSKFGRPRSASPELPPIPYIKKKLQNASLPKISIGNRSAKESFAQGNEVATKLVWCGNQKSRPVTPTSFRNEKNTKNIGDIPERISYETNFKKSVSPKRIVKTEQNRKEIPKLKNFKFFPNETKKIPESFINTKKYKPQGVVQNKINAKQSRNFNRLEDQNKLWHDQNQSRDFEEFFDNEFFGPKVKNNRDLFHNLNQTNCFEDKEVSCNFQQSKEKINKIYRDVSTMTCRTDTLKSKMSLVVHQGTSMETSATRSKDVSTVTCLIDLVEPQEYMFRSNTTTFVHQGTLMESVSSTNPRDIDSHASSMESFSSSSSNDLAILPLKINSMIPERRRVNSALVHRESSSCRRPRSVPLTKRGVAEGPKALRAVQGSRSLIDSIKEKVFPSPQVPTINEEEPNSWEDPEHQLNGLKFPKETRNAMMMLLSDAEMKITAHNGRKYQISEQKIMLPAETQTLDNKLTNNLRLPCTRNLLCDQGVHNGKCKVTLAVAPQKHAFWCQAKTVRDQSNERPAQKI